jgi:hypothetical protein
MKTKLLFVSMILFGCVEQKSNALKYKEGDVVYLKPDSTKAVVTFAHGEMYSLSYKTEFGEMKYLRLVRPTSIY